MFSFLKNHPFAVEAHFDSSIVLTFAAPKAELQGLIPECLELDTFEDKWAFLAVAMVQTKGLRPKGLPQFLGNDFFLIGYRVFVRYRNTYGKRMRGLYILRSETDSKRMEIVGNLFTHYSYATIDIAMTVDERTSTIVSTLSDLNVQLIADAESPRLPADSPFENWKEARRFAGPLPFTFSYDRNAKTVLIIEGVRQDWVPTPIEVVRHKIGFIDSMNLNGLVLANAFIVRNVPYHWKKGRIEKWNG